MACGERTRLSSPTWLSAPTWPRRVCTYIYQSHPYSSHPKEVSAPLPPPTCRNPARPIACRTATQRDSWSRGSPQPPPNQPEARPEGHERHRLHPARSSPDLLAIAATTSECLPLPLPRAARLDLGFVKSPECLPDRSPGWTSRCSSRPCSRRSSSSWRWCCCSRGCRAARGTRRSTTPTFSCAGSTRGRATAAARAAPGAGSAKPSPPRSRTSSPPAGSTPPSTSSSSPLVPSQPAGARAHPLPCFSFFRFCFPKRCYHGGW
jgi:hypothetical protein